MANTNVNPHEATRPGPGQNPPAVSTSSSSGVDHREAARVQDAERRQAEREAREAAQREEERQREELMEEEAGGHHEVVDPAVRQARADALARADRERRARLAAERRREEEEEAARLDEETRQGHTSLVPSFSPAAPRVPAPERTRTEETGTEEWVEEEAGGRGAQPYLSPAVAQARLDALHEARLARDRREKAAEDERREREARERSIANTQRIRDLNRASEAAFEEGVELAEMGSQPAPSPDVAQARESALVRAERERLQRAFPLVPTASPVRLPDGGPHGPTFLAGDHLPRPGQVIEDPSTGQPASDPAAQRPGDDGDKPLRDTVRDHEIQPLSEGGKMAANFLATQGGGDIQFAGLDIISREDDSRSELQKDEALWRREGDVLTAAFALDRTSLEIKAAEKRLANTKGKLDAVTDLNRGNEGPLAVNLMAKAQRDFDRAKANYDGAQAAHASLKKETEAAGILITPAHNEVRRGSACVTRDLPFLLPAWYP